MPAKSTGQGPRSSQTPRRNSSAWFSWLIGAAVLAAVIAVALHLSEGRELARLATEAKPRWLLVALLLQAATYYAQAGIFLEAPLAVGVPLSLGWAYQLSFGKLFLDQALPSGGISGTVLVTSALKQRGVTAGAAAATALINMVSYYVAYVVLLMVALVISGLLGHASIFILVASILFVAFGIGLTVAVLALSGRRVTIPGRLGRLRLLQRMLGFIEEADPSLIRSFALLGKATAWQGTIFLLDAATMWVLIHALGAAPSLGGLFASFMVSSLFRSVGVAPGGLGTYEATSVVTLNMIGVSLPVALASTLLFRGLSFWLPMLPGFWFSRKLSHP
jgi:P-type Mg2+ transporter